MFGLTRSPSWDSIHRWTRGPGFPRQTWALEAGVLDEVQIHVIPVLFGGGCRLFEVLPSRIELEIVRVIDTPQATHIRYRVHS